MGPVVLGFACVFSALNIRQRQDQSFDNAAAVCLALWARSWIWLTGCMRKGVWTDAPNRLLYEGSRTCFSFKGEKKNLSTFTLFKVFQI